ncbi:MAG: tetratricopeptide repeat protein [Myxococcales bacterium]|nr:tetratricopeptide repeat protein [Myxococcales bacterium]
MPPVAATPPAPAARRASDAQNSAGFALSKAGDHAGAAARYRQAVRLDPSNVVARYNLGCALNRLGKAEAARARLAELKAAGCPTCVGRLVRARQDPDWQSQAGDPAFVALTGDAKIAPAEPADVARAVEASFLGEKAPGLEAWLPRRRPVRVRVTRRQDDAPSARVMQVAGAELAAHLAGLTQGPDAPAAAGFGAMTCAATCCVGKAPAASKPTLVIERVCLRHDSAGVPILDRVELAERP